MTSQSIGGVSDGTDVSAERVDTPFAAAFLTTGATTHGTKTPNTLRAHGAPEGDTMLEVRNTLRHVGIRQRSLRKHCRLGRATELVFVLATGTILMLAGAVNAQDSTFTNGEGTGAWNTVDDNWSGGPADPEFTAGDNAIFSDTDGVVTIDEAGGISAGSLTVQDGGAGILIIQGNDLTLGGNIDVQTDAAATINATITGNADAVGAGSLSLSGVGGNVSNGGTGGVINIITRRPTEDTITYDFSTGVDVSLTSNQSDRIGYSGTFGVSAADERGDGVLAISYDTVNGQFDADGDRIIRNGINDTDRLGLLAKVGFNLTDEQRLGLTYNFFKDETFSDFTIDNSVLADPDAEFGRALRIDVDYEEPPEQVNHVLNLTYRHENIFGSQLDAQVYYRDTELV